jgi:hypothetical protein
MINDASITLSPSRDRDNGPKTQPGIKPSRGGDIILNLPAPARAHAL